MPTVCAISGNLEDLSSATNQGYVLFDLVNFGDNIPRVIGTAAMVNKSLSVQATSGGVISTNLWGNDNIDPAGTLYRVSVMDNTKVIIQTDTFNITGSTWNLNTATPTPVPPIPVTQPNVIESVTAPAMGNFTVSHSLGKLPTFAIITATSGGFIWFQQPTKYDTTTLYLVASAGTVTADIYLW